MSYPAKGVCHAAEETVTLQAGEIRTVELSGLLERAGLQGSPAARLDLAFDGEPSALLARLTVVDSSGYYAFDVPLIHPEGATGDAGGSGLQIMFATVDIANERTWNRTLYDFAGAEKTYLNAILP